MAIIGGQGTVAGPVMGAILLKVSSEIFRNVFKQANLLIYGLLLIAIILFMPDGLMGGVKKWMRARAVKKDA